MKGGAYWLNSYADLNEIVRVDLESLPFMDLDIQENTLTLSESMLIETTTNEVAPVKVKRCRTIRELLQSEQKIAYSKRALFEMIDILDIMNESIRIHKKQENEHLRFHLQRINEITCHLLKEYGIVEVDIMNHPFDASHAEVLAAIKAQEYDSEAPHLYRSEQIIAVHQRAFRDMETGELLRKAKVTVIE